MAKEGLTISMIVRDEEENLRELLPIAIETADDVVIVDTGSTDGTVAYARSLGARVIEQPWGNDFSWARNRGLDAVETSHVLWLDADDRLEAADILRTRETAIASGDVGLMLLLVNESRDPHMVSSCWQLRVFPSRPEFRFTGRIHEQIRHCLVEAGTPIRELDVTVRHTGYVDPREIIRKSRRNLELLRREMNEGREDDITVLYHFVKAATGCGELDAAREVARRCVDSPPAGTSVEILQACAHTLGRLEDQCGHTEEARRVFDDAVARMPDDPLALFFRADFLRRHGDARAALKDLEAARSLPVRTGNLPVPVAGLRRAIRIQMGELQEMHGRPMDATVTYREILADHPQDRSAMRALTRALIGSGSCGEAARILDEIEDDPVDRAERTLLRATLEFHRGNHDVARTCYEKALEEQPRAWAAHLHLGHLAMQRFEFAVAETHYEKALAIADNPETHVGRAAHLLETGRVTECLDHLAAAVDQSVNRPLPAGIEAVAGEALTRIGRWQEALGAFEKHLERFGPEARILTRLADCYRELRAPAAARMGYGEALKLEPGLEQAKRGLAALETVH